MNRRSHEGADRPAGDDENEGRGLSDAGGHGAARDAQSQEHPPLDAHGEAGDREGGQSDRGTPGSHGRDGGDRHGDTAATRPAHSIDERSPPSSIGLLTTGPQSRSRSAIRARFDRLDAWITSMLARLGVPALRLGLGVVFLWFGFLKYFPGLSPAQDLATRTVAHLSAGLVGPSVTLPLLATWETLIGVGLVSGRLLRVTLLLLAIQMVGASMPLVLFPNETFSRFPFAPTLEGQYIIKNVVLIGAAMVVGSTVRGGGLVPTPVEFSEHPVAQ